MTSGRRASWSRIFAVLAGLALLGSAGFTVAVMGDLTHLKSNVANVILLLNLDIALALLLAAILARRILAAWFARQFGSAGGRLHFRMVLAFSLVAVIPAVLVAIFAGIFLTYSLQSWFGDRVRSAVEEAQQVAELYLQENQQSIRADALAMANDINRQAFTVGQSPRIFSDFLTTQAALRDVGEAVVVDSSGHVLAQSRLSFSMVFDITTDDTLHRLLSASAGEVQIVSNPNDERVRAGIKLDAFVDAYLLVGRLVSPQVLAHVISARSASAQYEEIKNAQDQLQERFLIAFGLVVLLLLLAAVWIGWSVANQLATPIGKLIDAAERVRKGDLTASIETLVNDRSEVGTLIRAFNRMTEQLDSQRRGLMEANRQLDERRRFTETVLTGVSAGVVGLDSEGNIHLTNRSASVLLGSDLAGHIGEPLRVAVPEMAGLIDRMLANPNRSASGEVSVVRTGRQRTLVVSVAAERLDEEIVGFVVTFDDVTELLSAQRTAAWADVARRIAHEIKNPLTPIQLAAERLKRKYRTEITTDPETFTICTDTIVRQVEEIGRMVDEFSAFARMPRPDLKEIDLRDLVRQSVFLERNRFPDIVYDVDLPETPVMVRVDRQQIARTLTNLLKNAAEAIVGRKEKDADAPDGRIAVNLSVDDLGPRVEITDNGGGFPIELLHRITEPYVTTRERGTGLGLAIAKKIMEDHNGELMLGNNAPEGAIVVMKFYRGVLPSAGGEGAESAVSSAEALVHGA